MLEKPAIQEEKIVACLQDAYSVHPAGVEFLPLGADTNTAVYRLLADDGTVYFAKLRRGASSQISAALPRFLGDQGIESVIAPLVARTGELWVELGEYRLVLYPYVEGCNAIAGDLSECQWVELGAALRKVHTSHLPPQLGSLIPSETWSSHWRTVALDFLERVEWERYADPVALRCAALLRAKRGEIQHLVRSAARLAGGLQAAPFEYVLCHSDIHEANILLADGGRFYMVDWDDPVFAPKERDLMFIGGGICGKWIQAWQQERFYQGYGPVEINFAALAYYRCERLVQDIVAFCEQLMLSEAGGVDREQALHYLASNFLPGGVLEIALQTEQALEEQPGRRNGHLPATLQK